MRIFANNFRAIYIESRIDTRQFKCDRYSRENHFCVINLFALIYQIVIYIIIVIDNNIRDVLRI